VDTETEPQIFEGFRSLTNDRIAIPISHRFSTVRYADHIVVLDEGRIIEQRSHEELMRRRGRYARLLICRLVPIASDCQNTSSVG
jgi:ATP-binding cassette, subfamily B, bacterial